jgi:DNA-binding transcriptional regulator YhcF (GntR family)
VFSADKRTLNPLERIPFYMQMAKMLKDDIASGIWKPGDVLPSIKELAEHFHTSAKVPRKALALLAEEGLTVPRRSVGSIVTARGMDRQLKGRILVYSRGTGYSYYCAEFLSTFDSLLLSNGYKVFVINATKRGEQMQCRVLRTMLKEKWALVVLRGGGCAAALRIVTDSGHPFVFLGDGAPMLRTSVPSCIARVETKNGKALSDFIRECVRRGTKRVVQFMYAEGAFDVTWMLSHSGIEVKTVRIARKSSLEEVMLAAISKMNRMVKKKPLPDLFIFTDDYLAQGGLVALSVAGVRIPEDVAIVTLSNRGFGPAWVKPLSRLEMDASAHAGEFSDAVIDYLRTGKFPQGLEFGSVWKRGQTF